MTTELMCEAEIETDGHPILLTTSTKATWIFVKYTAHWENYFMSVGQKNDNNNLKLQCQHI